MDGRLDGRNTGRGRARVGFCLLVAVSATLLACGGSGDAGGAPIGVTGQEPWTPIVEFRGSMFGAKGLPGRPQRLVRSTIGEPWERVELPQEPDKIQFGPGPTVLDDVLAVTGRGVENRTFAAGVSMDAPIGTLRVWTTADGRNWTAAPAIDDVAPFVQSAVQAADGVLLYGVSSQDGRFHLFRNDSGTWSAATTPITAAPGTAAVLHSAWTENGAMTGLVLHSATAVTSNPTPRPTMVRSTDRGRTWTSEPCAETDPADCGVVPGSGPDLLLRGRTSSVDGGATWSPVTIRPDVGPSCSPIVMRSVVRVPGKGHGWVVVASIDEAGGLSDDLLLHSADGRTWRATTPLQCPSNTSEVSGFTDPVAHDGALWTVRTSGSEESGASGSTLLRSSDGRDWEPVPPTLGDVETSAPIPDGARVLVPVYDDLHRLTRLVPYTA